MEKNTQTGKIGVTTENIFPIIKKFLYSDHEIFLRELVSNAVDATQKIRTLAATGDCKDEPGEPTIRVALDKEARTITISDRGIGMDAGEVEKYINQIAFSGAGEFMKKYSDQAIIGHFGLGFYSSFMVADRVVIRTQSYRTEAKTVVWTCGGTPEFTMEETEEKRERGTDVILHIADESVEFLDEERIGGLLKKYCSFLPVPIVFGRQREWKDGVQVDTDRDCVVNDTDPLWTRRPGEIADGEYTAFYRRLYPAGDDPLFHIHLNIDYPFNLTGILYFPKIRNNFEMRKDRIQLYSNQVYVTDSVEGIVPEFLTLLHGVIDSPDIPLNVSRSYLQSDANVKKISSYITRKVADRLNEIFAGGREEFERKWDDLKVFIEYGIVTDEKFAGKAMEFFLLKNTEGKYFTFAEYDAAVGGNQTDRNGTLIYLYTEDPVKKFTFVEAARRKGYDVLLMDGQLDGHFINRSENNNARARFVRVDSDVTDKLIGKENAAEMMLSDEQQELMKPVFESQLPADDGTHYNVAFEALGADDRPVVITQNEYMRRMKEMAAMGGDGMSQFYGRMPDNFTISVNGNHPLVIDILRDVERTAGGDLEKSDGRIGKLRAERQDLDVLLKGRKEDELTPEEKTRREELDTQLTAASGERDAMLREAGAKNRLVKQLIDLALLSNGMLSGESLDTFISRSVELIGKND